MYKFFDLNIRLSILILLLFALLTGCADKESDEILTESDWQEINEHIDVKLIPFETYVGDSTTLARGEIKIYRLNQGYEQSELQANLENNSSSPKRLSEWKKLNSNAELIINAGYHHEDYSPSGYLEIENARVGERQFDLHRSGFVAIKDGKLSLLNSYDLALVSAEFDSLLQSYPFLIVDGQPAIDEDSKLLDRRTALGSDAAGNIYAIIVETPYLSLFELMKKLMASDIEFTNVLNLDGGTSTGIVGGDLDSINSWLPVPSVLVLE